MKMRTYLRVISTMAFATTLSVAVATAQEGPVRAHSHVHLPMQTFHVEYHGHQTPLELGDWSVDAIDLQDREPDEDVWSGSFPGSELVIHTMSEMDQLVARATSWTRQSETVQPMFFVQNRLANIEARRTLEHLEPQLKGQNRVYCVGLRVTF